MSDACARNYRSELKNWVEPRWGKYDVRDFEQNEIRTEVEEWLLSLTKSPRNLNGRAASAVHHVYNPMMQVFKWGVKWGHLNFNPLAGDLAELPRGNNM